MKKIVIEGYWWCGSWVSCGEELAVSAAGERALRILKDSNYVAKKGAFQEGSGNYRSTCLPKSEAERAELGIDMVHYCLLVLYQRKSIHQERIARFFIEHPRCQLAVMGHQGRVDAILNAIDG